MLGRLEHPNVARIYEAGTAVTRGGEEPFIAMELVRGRPIDRYVREERPGDAGIVRLLVRVCAGVEAAHRIGIVHRDLKPANVLVGGDGVPRVLDFGIARVVDGSRGATALTVPGGVIGTLAYLAPEQLETGAEAAGPAADVYALGVMLHELLTGRLPVETDDVPLAEVARRLQERPTARLTGIDPRFRGDLDVIVQTALAVDVARRYPTVAALREDLERHLRHEPIAARRPSATYRARKFVRRHRTLSVAAAAVFMILSGATVALAIAYGRAERLRIDAEEATAAATISEDRAVAQAERAERLLQFFTRDLLRTDETTRGTDLTFAQALDAAAPLVDERFGDDPDVAGVLHRYFAFMYRDLGVIEKSLAAHEKSTAYVGAAHGASHGYSGVALVSHAQSLGDADRWDDAERVAREGYRILWDRPDTADRLRFIAAITWADALQVLGRHDEARPILREVVAQAGATGEHRHEELGALNILGGSLLATEEWDAALEVIEVEIAGCLETHPDGHPQTTAAMSNRARAELALGRPEDAEGSLREALAIQRRTLPAGHWRIGFTVHTLSGACAAQGRHDEAAAAAFEACRIFAAAHGPDHHRAVGAWRRMIDQLVLAGALDDALAADAGFLDMLDAADTPPPVAVFEKRLDLAVALQDGARPADAGRLLADVRDEAAAHEVADETLLARIDEVGTTMGDAFVGSDPG